MQFDKHSLVPDCVKDFLDIKDCYICLFTAFLDWLDGFLQDKCGMGRTVARVEATL